MESRSRFALLSGLGIGIIGALIAVVKPDVLYGVEARLYDWNVSAGASGGRAESDVMFIDISDIDIQQAEQHIEVSWPWPRELYAELLRYAHAGGAKAVVFDLVFEDQRSVVDAIVFADALRDTPAVLAVTGDVENYMERAPLKAGHPVALLRTFADRAQALAAAVRLMSSGLRAFIVENTIYIALPSHADESLADAWVRLARREELRDLFAGRELIETELAQGWAKKEVSPSGILRERFGRAVPATPNFVRATLVPPIEVLAEAAPGVGLVTQPASLDGVVRAHSYFARTGDVLMPSLAMAAYIAAFPEKNVSFADGQLSVGGNSVPVRDDGSTLIRFRDIERFRHVGAYDVFASIAETEEGEKPRIAPSAFKDKVVFVSATAKALQDYQPSPLERLHPGAEITAEAVDNLIRGEFVTHASPLAEGGFTVLVAVLVSLLVMSLSQRFRTQWWGVIVAAGAGLVIVFSCLLIGRVAYTSSNIWLATFVPGVTAGMAAINGLIFAALFERGDRRFVQEALGRYTSKALVDELLANPEKLSLNYGEKRKVSVYFSDIAGFTTISEGLDPEQLVALLNDYLTEMTDIVLRNGGVVDKYIGDAIMAFWGAPFDDKDHEINAVEAALRMKQACDRLRAHWEERFGQTVIARAGVNSGVAVAGNMGSTHKYNYTVMGDMVNLAARLEGANKAYGTDLMISESTHRVVADQYYTRELDSIAVKGKTEPARVFEVLAKRGEEAPEGYSFVATFHDALSAYRALDFERAKELFQLTLTERENDGPSLAFIERCDLLLTTPPEPGWDGVWRMKEK